MVVQEKVAVVPTQRNTAIARRFIEACFNAGDLAVADELIARTAIQHTPSILGEPPGPGGSGIKREIMLARLAFPDLHVAITHIAADGDTVVARLWISGTHTGSYRGMPATGAYAAWDAASVLRIADGRIVELWWGTKRSNGRSTGQSHEGARES